MMRANSLRTLLTAVCLILAASCTLAIAQDNAAAENGAAVRKKLVAASKSPKFQDAIKKLAKLAGSEQKALETSSDGAATGGVWFEVSHAKADELLAQQRKAFAAQGAYLFRSQNMHGLKIGNETARDAIALLPTTNQYEVLQAVETEGPNSKVYNPDLLKWLKELEKTQPFELTDAGDHEMAGKFTTPVKDPKALAAKVLKLCPDFDQGDGEEATLKKLAVGLSKGNLTLVWT